MTSTLQTAARLVLGGALVLAGVEPPHVAREGFARPGAASGCRSTSTTPCSSSGVAEIALGAALAGLAEGAAPDRAAGRPRSSRRCSPATSPSTVHRRDGLHLDTDLRRAIRLPFQPVLIAMGPVGRDPLHPRPVRHDRPAGGGDGGRARPGGGARRLPGALHDGLLLFDTASASGDAETEAHYRPVRMPLAEALAAAGAGDRRGRPRSRTATSTSTTRAGTPRCPAGRCSCSARSSRSRGPAATPSRTSSTSRARATRCSTARPRSRPASGSIPTPGHTAGHQSLLVERGRRVLLAGQTHDTASGWTADVEAVRRPTPTAPAAARVAAGRCSTGSWRRASPTTRPIWHA